MALVFVVQSGREEGQSCISVVVTQGTLRRLGAWSGPRTVRDFNQNHPHRRTDNGHRASCLSTPLADVLRADVRGCPR